MSTPRKVIIIAGPNGAGKTTFAREFLVDAECPIFLNADLIAAELAPSRPEAVAIRAGRIMLEEVDRLASAGRNFAIETTLSGFTYVKRIDAWRAGGYTVKLYFLALSDPDEAVARVATRVHQGGHAIPEDVIRRRFDAGMRNFLEIYRYRVDYWQWFDNSGPVPRLLEEGTTR